MFEFIWKLHLKFEVAQIELVLKEYRRSQSLRNMINIEMVRTK